ncbi:GNAT family N-acetyltransferase [Paenibacillus thermotolerans]|uniref:GNAT family N-acetyltransferase n=1 Tax=Paenibacillus thermotolerans TaxID=3027807 RepID=UPI002367E66A|nr:MULTISPECIES: GNAT family protein [unclassified Paenibacillus]
MNIRVLNESDAQLYQQLRLNALKTNPEAFGSTYEREAGFSLETVSERLRPSEEKFALGAMDRNGRLAGTVTFVRETGPKTRHKGNIYGMYVVPEVRGKGVGKSLLLELIGMARHCDGLEQLHLTVVSANDSAIKLYKSLGFEVYGIERDALKFNGQYFDEELMALRL